MLFKFCKVAHLFDFRRPKEGQYQKIQYERKEQQEIWESFGKLAEALLSFSLKENNTRENYIYLQLLQSDFNLI
jgi:hypothetical protein